MSEIELLVAAMKEDRENTVKALAEMEKSINKMSDAFTLFYQHIATVESEKKHNEEFKKETRAFQEYAKPILVKAKDGQEIKAKLLFVAGSILITSLAVLLGVKI